MLESDYLGIGPMTYLVCDLEQIFNLCVPWLPRPQTGNDGSSSLPVLLWSSVQVKHRVHAYHKLALTINLFAPSFFYCKHWSQIYVAHNSCPRLPSIPHPSHSFLSWQTSADSSSTTPVILNWGRGQGRKEVGNQVEQSWGSADVTVQFKSTNESSVSPWDKVHVGLWSWVRHHLCFWTIHTV